MRYMGGKFRIAKKIVELLNSYRTDGQLFVEPFMGGCNILPLMTLPKWGNDINKSVSMCFEAIRDGWVPPSNVSEELYNQLKNEDDSSLRGFVGIACSFGGKFFGGYARGGGE